MDAVFGAFEALFAGIPGLRANSIATQYSQPRIDNVRAIKP
jgi:hypothetical protein